MRVTKAPSSRNRRKKVLANTKGMGHARRTSYRLGKQAVIKGLEYSYRDRRNKKRTLRQLWILRINALLRQNDTTYSQFMNVLKKRNITLNRKILGELAAREPEVFQLIIAETTKK